MLSVIWKNTLQIYDEHVAVCNKTIYISILFWTQLLSMQIVKTSRCCCCMCVYANNKTIFTLEMTPSNLPHLAFGAAAWPRHLSTWRSCRLLYIFFCVPWCATLQDVMRHESSTTAATNTNPTDPPGSVGAFPSAGGTGGRVAGTSRPHYATRAPRCLREVSFAECQDARLGDWTLDMQLATGQEDKLRIR